MIRLATEEEYPELVKWARKDKFIKSFASTSFRWGWKDNLYILIQDNDIKGFIQFTICKRKSRASLYYMYIKPEERCKHYGEILFNFYLRKAKENNKAELYWKVYKNNTGAVEFYKKQGFTYSSQEIKDYIYITSFKNNTLLF